MIWRLFVVNVRRLSAITTTAAAAFFLPIVAVLLVVDTSFAFNLETRLPVIKRGINGSYFGYAVAAHQIRHESSSVEGLILVGAPLDKNLQPKTNRSGALWRCPLTSYPDDCKQVITDGRRNPQTEQYLSYSARDVDEQQLFPPLSDEIKEDQWLGVTVKSQGPGGKIMVCAHRYKVRSTGLNETSEDILGLGLCYILDQDLGFEKAHVQCRGRLTNNDITNFGRCQSGTSGLIFDDDNAIIGAPGTTQWRGAIFVFTVGDDYLLRDKTVYMGNGTDLGNDTLERIKKDGYMGMSLAAGYFSGDKSPVYVAGAPRANETGQVVMFRKAAMGQSSQSMNWHLQEYLIIGGEQIASSFGYEVAGADVNGDKLTDLIVGAPFYFNLTAGEGGAVYVYLNDPVKYLRDTVPMKLTGKYESRFGFAITSLGDLNKDGFDDIAIGAPYDGNGVVYVYLGSKNGLNKNPSQVLKPEILSPTIPITTFGHSLSGGIDLDENGYPDLVIGAYEKDVVVLLRSRPIIGFVTYIRSDTSLTNFDPSIRQCVVGSKIYTVPCFHFQTCCVVNSVVKTFRNRQLYVNYTLEAETFNNGRKSSRIWFDDFTNKSNKIEKKLKITSSNEICQSHVAFLKENTQDIQSPIQLRMSYTLDEKQPVQIGPSLVPLDDYPILNQQEADKVFNVTFLKNCGPNDICESRLTVGADFSLEPLREFGEEYPNYYQYVLGERKKITLNVNVSNLGESAYESKLFVFLPEFVSFGRLVPAQNEKKQHVCSFQNSFIMCELGNPLKENERVNLTLELDFQKVDDSRPSLDFNVVVNTTSENDHSTANLQLKIKVIDRIMLSISGVSEPEEVAEMVNTQLKGESAIRYKDEIGNKVWHYYTVKNNGPWRVSSVRVDIEWPFQVANDKPQGKWLFYLDEWPVVEGSGRGRCEIASHIINPNKYSDRESHEFVKSSSHFGDNKSSYPEKFNSSSSVQQHNRVKRDLEMVVKSETYTNKDGKTYEVVKLNCLLNTAKCLTFSCYLDSIGSNQFVNIIIKSRLWDSTLTEDYRDVDQIRIASRAKMHIPESKVTLSNLYSNEFQVETRARVTLHGQQSSAPVPLYILIGAIIVGLVLFILLTLLLWKFGFFKRRRPDPTLVGNLERHRVEEYHDY